MSSRFANAATVRTTGNASGRSWHEIALTAPFGASDSTPNATMSRRQRGQTFTECLVILVSVALIAMLGFSTLSSGIGAQSASMADALAGGPSAADIRPTSTPDSTQPALDDFDRDVVTQPAPKTDDDEAGSLAFAQGFVSGLIDTLWEEFSALLSPIETAQALAELVRLFATEFSETVQLLYDELIVSPLDTLFNGTDYERGIVVGGQVSPLKAVSVLAKASGAAVLVGAAKRAEDANTIPRINGKRPQNHRYAGSTHPSGVEFNNRGFPNFSPYSRGEVRLNGLTGDYDHDARLANQKFGLDRTPDGFVWHHVEDGRTMQLIPQDIHQAVKHTGGAAIIRERARAGR